MSRDTHQKILRLANRQLGLVERGDLLRAGLTQSDIHRRVKSGELLRVLPRVYRLASSPETWESLLLAALLWAGPGAVISHRAAARLHGLGRIECEFAEMSSDKDLRPGSVWILHHHSRDLCKRCVMNLGRLRVTTPTRTLVDLAAIVSRDQFEVAAEAALSRRLTSIPQIEQMLSEVQGRGRAGLERLREFLAERAGGGAAGSIAEIELLKLLRRAGMPEPIRQMKIVLSNGVVIHPDLAYPDERIAIEFDSYRFHSGVKPWSRDRARRNELTAMGWVVLQVTYEDLRNFPRFLSQLKRILLEREALV